MLIYATLLLASFVVALVMLWIIRRVADLEHYKHTVVARRHKPGYISSFIKPRDGDQNTVLIDNKGSSKTPWGW